MLCIKCEKVLEQIEPGIDTIWNDEDETGIAEETFIVRKYKCKNKKCKYHNKEVEVFYKYDRYEVEGDIMDEASFFK